MTNGSIWVQLQYHIKEIRKVPRHKKAQLVLKRKCFELINLNLHVIYTLYNIYTHEPYLLMVNTQSEQDWILVIYTYKPDFTRGLSTNQINSWFIQYLYVFCNLHVIYTHEPARDLHVSYTHKPKFTSEFTVKMCNQQWNYNNSK